MTEIKRGDGTLWVAAGPEQPGRPTVLLIHGAGGSRLDWPAPLRRLTGARVIALDLAGHGRSTAPVRHSMPEHAADIVAVLDALGLPSAVLAGHSMGGAVALQTALDAPDRVQGLTLISTGAKLRVGPAVLDASSDSAALAGLLRGLLWGEAVPEAVQTEVAARMAAADPHMLTADFAACAAFNVEDRLAAIRCPALVFCGRADRMTPLRLSETLIAQLRHAEGHFFEGAGHYLQLERGTEIAAQLDRWLGQFSER